jgi:hypothetical protein
LTGEPAQTYVTRLMSPLVWAAMRM